MIKLTNRDGSVFTFDPTESWGLVEDGVLILDSDNAGKDGTYRKLRIYLDTLMAMLDTFLCDGHRPVKRTWDEGTPAEMEITETGIMALVQAFVRAAEMERTA